MDKLTAKIKKYPFQTGIVIGVLACLILFGIVRLLSSGPVDLGAVKDVIREDYLRMTINDYASDKDAAKASWRFKHLGSKAEETLALMRRDPSVDAGALLDFTETVGKMSVFSNQQGSEKPQEAAKPAEGKADSGNVKKGLSPFAVVIFVILFLLIVAAALYWFWSEKKTREKKRRRESVQPLASEDVVVRMVEPEADPTPTVETEESASEDFEKMIQRVSYNERKSAGSANVQIPLWKDDGEPVQGDILSELTETEEPAAPEAEPAAEAADDPAADAPLEDEVPAPAGAQEEPEEVKAEEPAETEAAPQENPAESPAPEPVQPQLDVETVSLPVLGTITSSDPEPEEEDEPGADTDDSLIGHFSAVYNLGDDLFDETFSIEADGVFMGECGIGIGETLNNADPKAVTAFEVWLFDRSDIHTPTHYLLSDFAMTNEGIVERMKQKGNYDRIRKGGKTLIRTQAMEMEVIVTRLTYGNERSEKNSYFTMVTFDIEVRRAGEGAAEEHIVFG